MKKAVIYARYSSDSQTEQSIDGQLRVCKEYAEKIYSKHLVISQALMYLGVSEEVAVNDACKIEHVISDESFEAIKKHMHNR